MTVGPALCRRRIMICCRSTKTSASSEPAIELNDEAEHQSDETQHPAQRRRFSMPSQWDSIYDRDSSIEAVRFPSERYCKVGLGWLCWFVSHCRIAMSP